MMSLLHTRPLLLALVCAGALFPDVLLGGSSSTPSIVGYFTADGDVTGTANNDGVKMAVGHPIDDLLIHFTSAHGAHMQIYNGVWKQKKPNRYSADFSQSLASVVAGAYPDCKASAKLKLKKFEVAGDDLTSKLIENFKAKKKGYKVNVKTSGLLIGSRSLR